MDTFFSDEFLGFPPNSSIFMFLSVLSCSSRSFSLILVLFSTADQGPHGRLEPRATEFLVRRILTDSALGRVASSQCSIMTSTAINNVSNSVL